MINEKQAQAKVLGDGQSQESIGMSLDLDSAHVLMQMLSKNLYSDPIGSTIRECASNALDSHRRANVTEPIIVSLRINNENNYEFTVEDFGTGLDADDVVNIISKYGKSTKRETNDEIGMMGLGFKSPLAYSSSFYFVCRKDGVERKYMMYEGEDTNTIDLLFETPTTERNGVKIIVPIKYADRMNFYNKIREQLCYFESVYFDVNVQGNVINNDFAIHRAEDYQMSSLCGDMHLHICLDNVYYPIDFNKLGILQITGKIGLRFKLSDGIFPTPNREQLIYTSQAKKTILEKLKKVSEILVAKYNELSVECNNLDDVFDYYGTQARAIDLGDLRLDVAPFVHYSSINFKKPVYKDYKLIDFQNLYTMRDQLLAEYKVGIIYTRGTFRQQNYGSYNSVTSYSQLKDKSKLFLINDIFKGHKRAYLKTLLPGNTYDQFRFYRKTRTLKLRKPNHSKSYSTDNYYDILRLGKYPKDQWRDVIKEFQAIQKDILSGITVVDDIVIPQSWLDAQKKIKVTGMGTKRIKLQGDINCRVTSQLQRFVTGKNSKLVPTVIKAEVIPSSPMLFVYGKQDSEELMDGLFSVSVKQKVSYLVLSEREHKVISGLDVHNLMSIEKFMEGKNKPFKRIVSSHLIYKLKQSYPHVFSSPELLRSISLSLFETIQKLDNYCKANYDLYCSDTIYSSMLPIAEEHNLYDETIHTEYRHVKELLDAFPFIDLMLEVMPTGYKMQNNPNYRAMLTDLFKYHRIRMDYLNYKVKLNPTPAEETEEATV